MPHLTSVDPDAKIAQLDTGERIPIANMYDLDGAEVADPALCRRGVAGPDAEGSWYPFACGAEEEE